MAYSENQKTEIINTICDRISKGESLRSVLRSENMPSLSNFFAWIDNNKDFQNQYARATELRAETIFEDILNISDSTDNDIIELPDGSKVTNHHAINRDRLRVDSRKWMLAKMMPKKYGEKLDIDHTTKGNEINQTPVFVFKNLNETE